MPRRNRITQYIIKGVGNAGMQANVKKEICIQYTEVCNDFPL
jgi:hypothetical protein